MAKTAPFPGLAGPEESSGDRQFSISLSRGLQLLRAFGPGDATLGNRELCDRTGLPKATVSRLAYTLMMLGYLSRGADNRYALGSGVLTLGYPMLAGMRIRQIARPWLERLARESGGTVNLGMRDRLSAVYVDTCSADRANAWRPDIGSVVPLLTTAIGCALLAASTAAEQSAVLNRLRVQDPDRFNVERVTWEAGDDGDQLHAQLSCGPGRAFRAGGLGRAEGDGAPDRTGLRGRAARAGRVSYAPSRRDGIQVIDNNHSGGDTPMNSSRIHGRRSRSWSTAPPPWRSRRWPAPRSRRTPSRPGRSA